MLQTLAETCYTGGSPKPGQCPESLAKRFWIKGAFQATRHNMTADKRASLGPGQDPRSTRKIRGSLKPASNYTCRFLARQKTLSGARGSRGGSAKIRTLENCGDHGMEMLLVVGRKCAMKKEPLERTCSKRPVMREPAYVSKCVFPILPVESDNTCSWIREATRLWHEAEPLDFCTQSICFLCLALHPHYLGAPRP